MPRRRRNREADLVEMVAKLVMGGALLFSLAIGGIAGFPRVFASMVTLVAVVVVLGIVGTAVYFCFRYFRAERVAEQRPWTGSIAAGQSSRPAAADFRASDAPAAPVVRWSGKRIDSALGKIDWFQFEKFCATLLRGEGYTVERKGGAHPDGGVDLVATKDGESMLVQCKHWRTWDVQERVIRELLGSLAHFKVARGAVYTLKGWTRPAAVFAAQHGIQLVDGESLAARAISKLTPDQLDELLSSDVHHCPKCESRMVWRTGDFTPFWGCSSYPRCRGKLKQSGAR